MIITIMMMMMTTITIMIIITIIIPIMTMTMSMTMTQVHQEETHCLTHSFWCLFLNFWSIHMTERISRKKVSEWLNLTAFLGTVDIKVNIVHISHVIIAYTLESLSSLTQITHNLQATIYFTQKDIKKETQKSEVTHSVDLSLEMATLHRFTLILNT